MPGADGGDRMAAIPRELYKTVEERLSARLNMTREAAEAVEKARSDASALKSPMQNRVGGRPSGTSDSVYIATEAILRAEALLRDAGKWEAVFTFLDSIFAGSQEGRIAEELYFTTPRRTMSDVAVSLGVDRQTVRRMRDTYVTRAALLAAEAGLVQIGNYGRT